MVAHSSLLKLFSRAWSSILIHIVKGMVGEQSSCEAEGADIMLSIPDCWCSSVIHLSKTSNMFFPKLPGSYDMEARLTMPLQAMKFN